MPVFTWNLAGLKMVKWQAPDALAPGKHVLQFDFKYDGLGAGTLPFNDASGIGCENLDVGSDTGTPVDDADYQVPFKGENDLHGNWKAHSAPEPLNYPVRLPSGMPAVREPPVRACSAGPEVPDGPPGTASYP